MKRVMEQINIAIPDELRLILNARADAAGHKISEEVRILLWAGLAAMTIKPVSADWAREAALTHAAWTEAVAR